MSVPVLSITTTISRAAASSVMAFLKRIPFRDTEAGSDRDSHCPESGASPALQNLDRMGL
jgi:hypothetical protein